MSIECAVGDYGYDYNCSDNGSECNLADCEYDDDDDYYFGEYQEYNEEDENEYLVKIENDDIDMDIDDEIEMVTSKIQDISFLDRKNKFAVFVYDFHSIRELARFPIYNKAIGYLDFLRITFGETDSQVMTDYEKGIVFSNTCVYDTFTYPRLAIVDLYFNSERLHYDLCTLLEHDRRILLENSIQCSLEELMDNMTV